MQVSCVEEGHTLRSQRQLRAEQVAPQLQQLQAGAARAEQLAALNQGAARELAAQLQEVRAQLQQLQDAQRSLEEAVEAGGEEELLRRAWVAADQQLQQLQVPLLDFTGTCRIQLREAGQGQAAWEASIDLGSDGSLGLDGLSLEQQQGQQPEQQGKKKKKKKKKQQQQGEQEGQQQQGQGAKDCEQQLRCLLLRLHANQALNKVSELMRVTFLF